MKYKTTISCRIVYWWVRWLCVSFILQSTVHLSLDLFHITLVHYTFHCMCHRVHRTYVYYIVPQLFVSGTLLFSEKKVKEMLEAALFICNRCAVVNRRTFLFKVYSEIAKIFCFCFFFSCIYFVFSPIHHLVSIRFV